MSEYLHRPNLYQPIRAGREDAPAYLAYLNSPEWRKQRNRALKLADYKCARCGSKRRPHVHHLTYERLGKEWDQDLEVLCESCHKGEHLESPDQTGLGVFIKIASDVISADPFADIADLSEIIKRQCVSLRIPFTAERIHSALAVCGLRLRQRPTLVRTDADDPRFARGLTHQESVELLSRLGFAAGETPQSFGRIMIQAMPATEKTGEEQQAHERRIEEQIAKFKDDGPQPKW